MSRRPGAWSSARRPAPGSTPSPAPTPQRCATPPSAGSGTPSSGAHVRTADRRGKWLTIGTDGASVVVHLGMTGALRWEHGEGRRGTTGRDR